MVSILARPSRAGRRLARRASTVPTSVCFNPRPALAGRASLTCGNQVVCAADSVPVSILARPSRAGRHQEHLRADQGRPVSILARPSRAGRQVHFMCDSPAEQKFQSSPGPRGPGVPASSCRRSPRPRFNPRPALAGRASCWNTASGPSPRRCFNPRPALAGRASRADHGNRLLRAGFNPRPALAGRASSLATPSIRGPGAQGFNPRPALAGRASLRQGIRAAFQSSRGRAFQSSPGPRGPGVAAARTVMGFNPRPFEERCAACFNPRPALAGRASLGCTAISACGFQSSPGPRGPGVRELGLPDIVLSSFQSSPGPRGPGVVGRAVVLDLVDRVSILARPSRAGRVRCHSAIRCKPL